MGRFGKRKTKAFEKSIQLKEVLFTEILIEASLISLLVVFIMGLIGHYIYEFKKSEILISSCLIFSFVTLILLGCHYISGFGMIVWFLFLRMIKKHKLKGMSTTKKEIFGKFRQGGLSSKIRFIDYLRECNKIRLKNGQNFLLVYFIYLIRFIKGIKKII